MLDLRRIVLDHGVMAGNADGNGHLAPAWRPERPHKGVEFFDCPFALPPGQLDALGKPFELSEGVLFVECLGFALIGHESTLGFCQGPCS